MNLDSVVFYTNDIDTVIDFYVNNLGLELEYQQDKKYASFLFANGIRLGIKKAVEDREIPGAQTLFIATSDIKRDYEKIKSFHIPIRKDLIENSWGLEFSFLDPDGNKIEFLQRK